MLVQMPSASVDFRAQEMPGGICARVDRDRVEAGPVRELLVEHVRAELLGQLAVPRPAADDVHPLGTEGERDRDRVERDRAGAHRDQDGRAGPASSGGATHRQASGMLSERLATVDGSTPSGIGTSIASA